MPIQPIGESQEDLADGVFTKGPISVRVVDVETGNNYFQVLWDFQKQHGLNYIVVRENPNIARTADVPDIFS